MLDIVISYCQQSEDNVVRYVDALVAVSFTTPKVSASRVLHLRRKDFLS